MTYKPSILDTRPPIDTGYIGKLLSDVFGVESPVYIPWWYRRDYVALPFIEVEVKDDDPEYDNAPVRYDQKTWGAFWLKGGKYLSWDYTGELKETSYSDLLMPLATLVDFNRDKTVTKTPTIGGMGTVKEVYGLDDWSISIKGIILPDKYNPYTQQTVDEQMDAIQKFHEVAGSIEVEGQVFAKRKIYRIVTESLAFSPLQGKPNMMQYTIQAISDEDLLLTDNI